MAGKYDDILAGTAAAVTPADARPASKYDDILDASGPAKATLSVVDQTPEQAAKNRKLADATGMPDDVVKSDPKAAEKAATEQMWSDALSGAPITSAWLTEPKNAEIASDSVGQLSAIERLGNSFVRGYKGQQQNREQSPFNPVGSPEVAAQLEAQLKATGQHGNDALSFFEAASSLVGQQAATATSPYTAPLVAGGAAIGTFVLPGLGTAGGAGIGARVAFGVDSFLVTSGDAYQNMIEAKVPETTAKIFSAAAGVVVGALDTFALRYVLKPFGIAAEEVSGAVVKGAMAVAKRAGLAYGEAVAGETITEGLQEVAQIATEEVAKAISPEAGPAMTKQQILDRVYEASAEAFKAMTVLAVPGAGASARRERNRQREATNAEADASELQKELAGSRVAKLDPEAAVDHFKSAVPEFSARIDIDKLVETAAAHDISPEEMFARLGVSDQVDMAALGSGEIVLDAVSAARIMLSEDWNDLKGYMRFGDNAYSTEDAKLSKEDQKTIAEEALAPEAEAVTVKLFRGSAPGVDPNTETGPRFYSPDEAVATAHANGGQVVSIEVTFENLLTAANWAEAKLKLGLEPSATMPDLTAAAAKAGYDGVTFKANGKPEYVVIPKEKAAEPAPQISFDAAVEYLRAQGISEVDISKMSKKDVIALAATDPNAKDIFKFRVGLQPAEAEIQVAEQEAGLLALFGTAKEAGVIKSIYAAYLAAISRAKEASALRQERRALRAEKTKLGAEIAELRAPIEMEVREKVNAEPVYQALGALTGLRLDRDMLVDLFLGSEDTKAARAEIEKSVLPTLTHGNERLASPRGEKGVNPQIFAELHGFENARQMLAAMKEARPREVEIFERTEREMEARYPEEVGRMTGIGQALESIHNDRWAEVLAFELNQLRVAKDQGRVKPALIREQAQKNFAGMKLRDVNANRFLQQEGRRAKEAGRLIRKDDRVGAAKAKFQQLVSFEYFRAAIDFKDDQASDKAFARRFEKGREGTFAGKAADQVDAVKTLLQTYGLITLPDAKAAAVDIAKAQAILAPYANMLPPVTSVKEMTVDGWRTVFEVAREIYQAATDQGKLQTVGKAIELATHAQAMVESAAAMADTPSATAAKLGKPYDPGVFERAKAHVLNIGNWFAQMSFVFQRFDMGDPAGPWAKFLYRPFERANQEQQRIDEKHFLPLAETMAKLSKKFQLDVRREVKDGVGYPFTDKERFVLGLNFGNSSNVDKVLAGMPQHYKGTWTFESVRAEIASLPKEMTDLMQQTWDAWEAVYPEVQRVYRDEKGESPQKVVAQGFILPDGRSIKGGYYPMIYDFTKIKGPSGAPIEANKNGVLGPEYHRASVYSGMTKARTAFTGPVVLDFGRTALAFRQVSHYVSHYDAVKNARKLLETSAVANTVIEKEGAAALSMMKSWVDRIATDGQNLAAEEVGASKAAEYIRSSATAAFLALSVRTLIMQPLGVANSIALLGRKADGNFSSFQAIKSLIWDGYKVGYQWNSAERAEAYKFMADHSALMETRLGSIDAAMGEFLEKARGDNSIKTQITVKGLRAIAAVQYYSVDVPTWFGAFNKAIAEGRTNEDAGIVADKIVAQAQGDGRQFALSSLQASRNPIARITTVFATFIFAQHNQAVQIAGDRKTASYASLAARAFWVIAAGALAEAMLSGGPPDDEENKLLWYSKRIAAQGLNAMAPVGGDEAASMLKFGRASRGNLAGAVVEAVGGALGDIVAVGKDAKDFDNESVKKLVKGFGMSLGVPGTSQAIRILDAMSPDEEDKLATLLMGRPPKK